MAVDQPFAGAPPAPGHKSSDSGLSGLGLIMQLVGGIMTAIVGTYGLFMLVAILQSGGRGGAPGSVIVWLLAVVGTSLARSIMHQNAGKRLLYEGAGTPLSTLNKYITMAFVQTGVVCAGLLINSAPGGIMLGLLVLLGAWPLALLIVARPKIAEFGEAVPMADDKGFEGASILLLIFGSIGLGIGSIMLLGWLDWPGPMKTSGPGLGMLVVFAMLTIRSALHLRAGVRGTKATVMSDTAEAATKYASFGVIASVVAGGVFLLTMLTSLGGTRGAGPAMILMLLMVVMLTWVLLVWPLTVKRFFSDRQFATMVSEGPGVQRSADRGLSTLGWLLLAFGVYAAATGLFGVMLGDAFGDDRAMRRMSRSGNPLGEMMGLFGSVGGKSPWFGIGVAALQIWAGVELIRMSPRYKLAGMVFGGVAAAVALYIYLPLLGDLMSGGAALLRNPLAGMLFASVAMALVVPIATLVFVQRKVHDPKAIAQTFE